MSQDVQHRLARECCFPSVDDVFVDGVSPVPAPALMVRRHDAHLSGDLYAPPRRFVTSVIKRTATARSISGQMRMLGRLISGPIMASSSRHIPGVADRFARHVPPPRNRRSDAQIEARTRHPDALDWPFGVAVDPDTACDEWFEGHQVVDDEGYLMAPCLDAADFAGAEKPIRRNRAVKPTRSRASSSALSRSSVTKLSEMATSTGQRARDPGELREGLAR